MGKLALLGLAAWALPALAASGACEKDYPIWIPRSKTADPLYRFERGGRAGYIDARGRIVVEPRLPVTGNLGFEFHDGVVEAGGLRGSFDAAGKFTVGPGKGPSPLFSEGLAKVPAEGKYGFIDRSGNFVIPPRFAAARDFSDGMARVGAGGECVYAPEESCGAANPPDTGAAPPDARTAAVCRFTFIDKTGQAMPGEPFDAARDFAEGLAPVKRGGRWGFIDKTGNVVLDFKYEEAYPFSGGLARVKISRSYGFIDSGGRFAVPPWFEYAEDFSDGLAPVSNEEEGFWYIDRSGQPAIPARYALASPFFKGLAHVQLLEPGLDGELEVSAGFAYIDKTGRIVFRYTRQ